MVLKNVRKRESTKKNNYLKYSVALVVSLIIIAFVLMAVLHTSSRSGAVSKLINNAATYHNTTNTTTRTLSGNTISTAILFAQVTPQTGYTLSFKWGGSIKKLVEAGAINVSNLTTILNNSHQPLTLSEKDILNGTYTGYIQFNSTNTEFVQIVLWGLGINNNNTIITKGPIINASTPYANSINANSTLKQQLNQNITNQNITSQWVASHYFASTGGYGPIGKLQMGMLNVINLTPLEQGEMYDVATHSYRPCCDNPTAFPDCNHGAAALGLIELLASQGANQTQMFSAVQYFYQYQFPQQYAEIAAYFDSQGMNYSHVNSSTVMGFNFSSYSGFSNVNQYLQKNGILQQLSGSSGASCGA